MVAQAAGVFNAGPATADAIETDNNPLAAWNPDWIPFDPVWHDTDGSVDAIRDGYAESRIEALLASPGCSGVPAVENRSVHPLRLWQSQFVVQSMRTLTWLAYPDLFPDDQKDTQDEM